MHFLMQVLACFAIVFAIMIAMTLLKPLREPRKLPVREDIALKTEPVVIVAAGLVITAVAALFLIFR